MCEPEVRESRTLKSNLARDGVLGADHQRSGAGSVAVLCTVYKRLKLVKEKRCWQRGWPVQSLCTVYKRLVKARGECMPDVYFKYINLAIINIIVFSSEIVWDCHLSKEDWRANLGQKFGGYSVRILALCGTKGYCFPAPLV